MMIRQLSAWLAGVIFVSGCVNTPDSGEGNLALTENTVCEPVDRIGRFDPAQDLFIAQFDIKTDTDDLHSAAAVATMLAHNRFKCVDFIAVSGTYGTQGGAYVDPETLFENAFGEAWVDAHADRGAAVVMLATRMDETLAKGGHVWIMEAGQSDVSAQTLQSLLILNEAAPIKTHVHIVQHSDWNERVTSPEALAFVQSHADYIKIPDGNAEGNGSPGFNTLDQSAWGALLTAAYVGPLWQQAKDLALASNGSGHDDESIAAGGYDNKSIGAGGLDFSDTSEAAWIFGYETLLDVDEFLETFISP